MKRINFSIIILIISHHYCCAQQSKQTQNIVLPPPGIESSITDTIPNFCGISQDINKDCLTPDYLYCDSLEYTKTIRIQSTGAKGIECVFKKFVLSPHAKVTINGSSKQYEYSGMFYTIKKDSSLISNYLPEDNCTISISVPVSELSDNQIVLDKINHYIIPLHNEIQDLQSDYSCMIDVNCQEGNNWCDQKRSVAMFIHSENDGLLHYCTGALVNNYRDDFVQYFLTARHCTDGNVEWSSSHFYFNYQRAFCNDGTYTFDYIIQGSQLIGYCDVSWSDNALLLITEPIPIQYNVYYAGVDIMDRSAGDDVTCIHHSDQLPKKITSGEIKYFAGPKWDVYWNNGIIMGGGSGAPVFLNSNKRVIATISGGPDYDCSSSMKHDWVGKVKSCVDYSDAINDALFGTKPHYVSYQGIDPIHQCQPTLNLSGNFYSTHYYDATLDGLTIQAANKITVNASSHFHHSANYTLTAGTEIIIMPGTIIEYGSEVTAKIAPCSNNNLISCGTHSDNFKNASYESQAETNDDMNNNEEYAILENMILEDENITIHPNPNNGTFTIETAINPQEIVSVQVVNMLGKSVYTQQGLSNSPISIPTASKGVYVVKVATQHNTYIRKIVVQ